MILYKITSQPIKHNPTSTDCTTFNSEVNHRSTFLYVLNYESFNKLYRGLFSVLSPALGLHIQFTSYMRPLLVPVFWCRTLNSAQTTFFSNSGVLKETLLLKISFSFLPVFFNKRNGTAVSGMNETLDLYLQNNRLRDMNADRIISITSHSL